MSPDKTAIEKRYVFNDPSDNACCAHKRVEERREGELTVTQTWWECVMCGLEFTPKRAALSEAEGERERLQREKDIMREMQKAKAERDDYKCRWWRAHGELMIALGAPMTDRQNTAMKEISEIPDSKILEVLREQ